MKKFAWVALLSMIGLLLPAPAIAQAPPIPPNQFYGEVTIIQETSFPAPDGLIVSAKINGEVKDTCLTEDGKYGYAPDVLKVPGSEGDLIEFYLNEVKAGEKLFESGAFTKLDFLVAMAAPSVTTQAATEITTNSAVLNGSLDSLGDALPGHPLVMVSFEWSGGQTTPIEMTEPGSFSASLSGLSSSTTYYFRAKAVGIGTSYGSVMSFTTKAPPKVVPPPPPPLTIKTNLFGIPGEYPITPGGKILETIAGTSEDGMLTVTIPEGTTARDVEGNRLESLGIVVDETPPPPPEDTHIIGLAYDFGPSGATFEPSISVTWRYDPEILPEGVEEENLVLAYYDEEVKEWVEIECLVDTVNNVITASVSHFTTFAILGPIIPPPPPAPAIFTLSNLRIEPAEVQPGQVVNITVTVANKGGMEGSYEVVLKINEVVVEKKTVIVGAGQSKDVTFSVTEKELGSYRVAIEKLEGSFTVLPVKPVISWLVLGGVIAAVVVIGFFIYLLVIRRRAY